MNVVNKIHSLLLSQLQLQSPVLSGNMQTHIEGNAMDIVIAAPFYDIKKWRKSGVIIPTGQTVYGKTDYAEWVNRLGAFGTHNKSEGWVNRTILEVVNAIANEIGAEVIYEL